LGGRQEKKTLAGGHRAEANKQKISLKKKAETFYRMRDKIKAEGQGGGRVFSGAKRINSTSERHSSKGTDSSYLKIMRGGATKKTYKVTRKEKRVDQGWDWRRRRGPEEDKSQGGRRKF